MSIGEPVADLTARDKVSGRFRFMTDVDLPGCLWGAVVRSPYAHAEVRSIDRRAILRSTGVVDVLGPEDVPSVRFNPATVPNSDQIRRSADKRVLTAEPQHVGDGVALIVADDLVRARAAATSASVSWRELPSIVDFSEALARGRVTGRVCWGNDDVEQLFSECHTVVEQMVELDRAQHVCLEPHACAAVPEDGGLTIWTQAQAPSELRCLLGEVLGMPEERLRIRKVGEGGGFGARQEMYEEALVACAALRLGRGVRVTYTRSEEFAASRVRHGGRLSVRLGFTHDGRLVVSDLDAALDEGAYASHTPYVLSCVAALLPATYPRATHRYRGRAVRTNTTPSGAYRGYGMAQAAAVVETAMEVAARQLDLDPVGIRRLNANKGVVRCLDALACDAVAAGAADSNRARGRGIAVATKHSVGDLGMDESVARLEIHGNSHIVLAHGTCDSGTGSSTALAQVLASALGAPLATIQVLEGDSSTSPMDIGSTAQRSVFCGSQAVLAAAAALRLALLERAMELTSIPTEELRLSWPSVVDDNGREIVHVDELVEREPDGRITVERRTTAVGVGPSYCALAVDVDVDVLTGAVRVTAVEAAVDCGTVVNPRAAKGQVVGGIAQGVGLACVDRFDPSAVADGSASILQHGVVRSPDAPDIHVRFVQPASKGRPPSGVGELPIVPVQAAVTNAVAAAIGRTPGKLPLTAQRVWAAARGGEHANSGS